MSLVQRGLLAAALTLATLGGAWAQNTDAFIRAIKQDNDGALRDLLAQGTDPNLRDGRGMPGLYIALQEGSLRAARVLVDSPRLKPETRTPNDESPLMMAALKGQTDFVRRLIARDADVNKTGWTPLHYAASGGHVEIIDLLLEHHAFIDAESPNGTTPLMMAAGYGTPEAVKLLIESGADIRQRNQKGMTALDFANQFNRPDAVRLLTDAAARSRGTQQPRGTW